MNVVNIRSESLRKIPEKIAFHRLELAPILTLYGRMVAAGEWRDYGISCLRDVAVFSIFKRTAENPLYRIEKRPKLRNKQGMYALIGAQGQILKRGHDLGSVLGVLERRLSARLIRALHVGSAVTVEVWARLRRHLCAQWHCRSLQYELP